MRNTQMDYSLRAQDTFLWERADISALDNKDKKHYFKYKAAIQEFFRTTTPVDRIAQKHHVPKEILEDLAAKCLMLHEDGMPWGFRALVPGVVVIDHRATSTRASGNAETHDKTMAANKAVEQAPAAPIESDGAIAQEEEKGRHFNRDAMAGIAEELDRIASEEYAPQEEADDDTAEQPVVKFTPRIALETPEEIAALLSERAATPEEAPVAQTETPAAEPASFPLVVLEKAPLVPLEAEWARPVVSTWRQFTPLPPSTVIESSIALQLPASEVDTEKRLVISPHKAAQQRRLVQKRRARDVHGQQQRRRLQRLFTMALLIALLLIAVVPAGAGLAAYSAYNQIKGLALDGVDHLLSVKGMLATMKSNPMAALNTTSLQQARNNFDAAERDFSQLQALVERPDVQSAVTQFAPEYGNKLAMAQRLVQVGLDVSRMGSEMSSVGLIGAGLIHSSPLAGNTSKPLISAAEITAIDGAFIHALYYINDVQVQMSHVQLKDLPISARQQAELNSVLVLLPKLHSMIVQAQGLIGIVSWVLGVGQARRFLVQTMDRAELRPGGGFTGQYGVLQIENGRMAPFSLRDVALLDYAGNGIELGRLAPPAYRSWMNFGNWGLRDANLSADFPTTARMAMQVFQEEGGGPVDGDIALTPVVIEHVLDVTGPIKVAEYGETITSKNLEDRLHYYQQNYSAIALEEQKTNDYEHAARKSFTSLVGKLLLERVKHLSVSQLMQVAKNAVKDIQSRDLEIYFTNPAAEAWLVQHGYSGAMDTFSQQDGFMVVQANISISKASQYVHTTEQDNVTLDAQGGATHNLTITLDYKPTGPIYGYDTYADYVRVYAPASAQFIAGDGFDTGKSCSSEGSGCDSSYFQSHGRDCPNGDYSLGQRGYTLTNTKLQWVVDSLGAPTALTSDLPGRAMFGGMTETPKNCTTTLTLSWYVPNAVRHITGQPVYDLLIQKQSGYVPTVELAIDASAIKNLKGLNYSGDLIADRVFAITTKN